MKPDMERDRPQCIRCRHFYVTWDPKFPRGCRAYGFKGREEPSRVVFRNSGMACQLFDERPGASVRSEIPPEKDR